MYYFGLPGPLKNLIDRQLPMSLPFMSAEAESGGHPSRYDMSGKRTVVVSTCGFYTAKGNYSGVTDLFDRLCGKDCYTTIFCGQGELFRVKELSERTDEYLSWVRKAGEEFATGCVGNAGSAANGRATDGISRETRGKLEQNLFPRDVFEAMADASWGVNESGAKEDPSLTFTRQMAALYRKQAWPGHDLALDMHYTDIDKTYRVVLGANESRVEEEPAEGFTTDYTTRINTPFDVWQSIAAGKIRGDEALMQHLYSVEGDFDLMMHWDEYFGAANSGATGGTDASAGAGGSDGPNRGVGADEAGVASSSGKNAAEPKTNMLLLLIPWIVFWIAASINSFWGSLISVAACVLLPVLMHRAKATAYDQISALAVGACSIALLAGASPRGGDSGVVCSIRANVERLLFPKGSADRALLQEQLQRGRSTAQPHLHEDEPHPDRGVGHALSGHAHLDVLHHADRCGQLGRRHQLGASRADGRVHRMVPEVAPRAHRPRRAIGD